MVGCYRRLGFWSLAVFYFIMLSAGAVSATVDEKVHETPRGIEIRIEQAEGQPVGIVYIHLENSTGDPVKDEALKNQVSDAFAIGEGTPFHRSMMEFGLKRVRRLDSIASAEIKLYRAPLSRKIIPVLFIVLSDEPHDIRFLKKGMLASGEWRDFPTIFEDECSRFVFILNGGTGVFSETDPWFGGFGNAFNSGNPTAEDPLGPGSSTWVEGYIEPGFGGIFQVSGLPLYTYGAVTYLVSGTAGHDIYNSETRSYGDFEKLYGGFIWDLPWEKSLVDVSFGRQVYQLRDGFLLSKIPVSTSIGERAALYLGPRLTSEYTALLRAKIKGFGVEAFLIEPSELDEIASDSQLAGINLYYQFTHAATAFTYLYIPESKSGFRTPDGVTLPREGVRTYNASLSMTDLFGIEGSWIKAEYAHQDHDNVDMSAFAGYCWIGYQNKRYAWQPAISYRWSMFSGDDTDTQTFERFDPLFSGGLGNFLPGIIFSKTYKNTNLISNRVTVSVKPVATLELILDYFHHRADELNNLGGIGPLQTLQSKDIGQELTLTVFHNIGRHLFFQGIASVGIPGDAIDQALGENTDNWYSIQGALYMFF